MKTLKFKLYQHKRNRYLKRSINTAGLIYNHCIALHKRYYRMFGKHLNCVKLQKHVSKLRKANSQWQQLGSQTVQEICQRIEKAYQLFFKYKEKGFRPPSFKKLKKYKSFTLKQAGYKLLGGNRIKIGKRVYRFWNSQPIEGKVKTITVKRTPLGELFLAVVVDTPSPQEIKFETGKIAGFDFGLKSFLTCSEGYSIQSPQFLKCSLKEIRTANKQLSRKQKGSKGREKARKHLARCHEKVVNQRRDWFWKLAHQLTDQFDTLYFETLNLKAMMRLWGRKVADLALREFINILEWVAYKKGKQVVFRAQWFASSKICSYCGHVLKSLDLKVREWECPICHSGHDRDWNASKNIKTGGIPSVGLGSIRQAYPATSV